MESRSLRSAGVPPALRIAGILPALILILPAFLFADTTETISKKILALDQQIVGVTRQLKQENKNNAILVAKSQQSEEALKAAYVSAERLSGLNSQLNQLREEHSGQCKEWRIAYAQTVDALLTQAKNEKSPKIKGGLGKKLQELQKQNIQLCPGSVKIGVSQEWRSIRVESYDGPQEVRQKTDLLQEISREIQIHLARLDQQLSDFQKERKTKERAQEFIQESTLFTDNVAVRRGTAIETAVSGPDGGEDKSSSGAEVFTRGDLYGKEQQEQFELQYQQKKKELLTQQKDLKQKLQELQARAQQLEIR